MARELTGLALRDDSDAAERNLPMRPPIDIDDLRMCGLSRNGIGSPRRESRQGDGGDGRFVFRAADLE
jgi:hypothetical protein